MLVQLPNFQSDPSRHVYMMGIDISNGQVMGDGVIVPTIVTSSSFYEKCCGINYSIVVTIC
uniref:Uncharacterized protein n=1 Tax=Arundo donax TaxID=35708 RepID=A0A0A9AAA3_ARUDO